MSASLAQVTLSVNIPDALARLQGTILILKVVLVVDIGDPSRLMFIILGQSQSMPVIPRAFVSSVKFANRSDPQGPSSRFIVSKTETWRPSMSF